MRKLPMRSTARWKRRGGRFCVGAHAGSRHDRLHLPEPGDRARIDGVAPFLLDRQGLARQGGLIDAQVIAFDQARVGGHDIAEADQQDIARDELARRDVPPAAIAQHARAKRQALLQGGDRRVGLELLPEADRRVEQQQGKNDREIRPVRHERRQHGGRLDHPRDRPPEIAGELRERAGLMLG
jgi:hypothetical protein